MGQPRRRLSAVRMATQTVDGLDPLMASARRALREAPDIATGLDIALKLLRRLGLLGPDKAERRALRNVPVGGLWRFVRRRLARAMPPTPQALAALRGGSLRLVTSGAELMAVGRRFRNCLGVEPAYLLAFAEQHLHFAVLDVDEPLVIGLTIGGNGDVHLDDAAMMGGLWYCPRAHNLALAALADAGVAVVNDAPPPPPPAPGARGALQALERLRAAACAAAIAAPLLDAEDLIGI